MSGTEREPIEKEVYIEAPTEEVFRYFVDPMRLLEWIGVQVDLDPRPGGMIRIDMNGRDVVRGEVLEMDPPRRIVFTWGWDRPGSPVPAGGSRVEVTLERRGEGTLLRLRHALLPPEVHDEHAEGWDHYLGRLGVAAKGGDPGPDPLATTALEHGAPGARPSEILRDRGAGRRKRP